MAFEKKENPEKAKVTKVKSMLFGKNGHTVYVYTTKERLEERLYSAIYDNTGNCLSTGYRVGGRAFDPSYWLVNGHPNAENQHFRPLSGEELKRYGLMADIDFR